MSLPLFYAAPHELDPDGGIVRLRGGEAAHIARSLRCRPGGEILVSDGAGRVYRVRLQSVEPREVRGSVAGEERFAEERPRVVLLQALGRPAKMDEAVALAAEAGISRLVPFAAPRSPEGSLEKSASRLDRWVKIAVEASKVARRPRPLAVERPVPWPPGGPVLAGQDLNVLLWEDERESALEDVLPAEAPVSLGIIIGPEGGFDSSEAALLKSEGAVAAGFGDLILRTQTAGPLAAAVVRYHYGLMRPGSSR